MSNVEFRAVSAYSDEHINRNVEYARSLGLRTIEQYKPTGPLAVVGGGLSALGYVETLRRWEGDVWAINGAHRWCNDNGIDSTFFSIDPSPVICGMAAGRSAILAERCDPTAFDSAAQNYVYAGTLGGCSSAGAGIVAGFKSGHQQITLFGTECNYQQGRTHVYGNTPAQHELIVKCAGMHFLTQPILVQQAKELAIMVMEAGGLVRETAGGLLRAMVNCECQYEIVEHTPGFEETLVPA